MPMQLGEDDLAVWDQEITAQPATAARVVKRTRRVRRLQTTDANTQDETGLISAAAVPKAATLRLRALQSAGDVTTKQMCAVQLFAANFGY